MDDELDDGDIGYTIQLSIDGATSDTTGYASIVPADVAVINTNDDTAGYAISTISGGTTEAGGTATFTMALETQPDGNVIINIASSDVSEGTATPAQVTFTAENWNINQTVTVIGVDDELDDGDIGYTIQLSIDGATSDTTGYASIVPADVAVINTNDDTAGYAISTISGGTTEAGGTATFTMALETQPDGNVIINIASSDVSEGTVIPAQVTFTNADWNTPKTVTVTGVDDGALDGNQAYSILLTANAATTDTTGYGSLDPDDVSVTNLDDDSAQGIITGTALDAADGSTLPGVQVTVNGTGLSALTDGSGNYTLPAVPPGAYAMDFSLNGYTTITQNVTVTSGVTTDMGNTAISPDLAAGFLRVVLMWTPTRNLDQHIYHPFSFHFSYLDTGSFQEILDPENSTSGPESFYITTQEAGDYTFKVHNRDEDIPICNTGAYIDVYDDTGHIQTVTVPAAGCNADTFTWNAFTLNGSVVTPVNTLSNVTPGGTP